MLPSIGRIVHYKLASFDAEAINRRRADFTAGLGYVGHVGNHVQAGEVYPAVVVRTFGGPAANLKVLLDGNDDYWATSRVEGDGECQWSWPPRV